MHLRDNRLSVEWMKKTEDLRVNLKRFVIHLAIRHQQFYESRHACSSSFHEFYVENLV